MTPQDERRPKDALVASVVIPVRNGASTIERQLRALDLQEDADFAWEVVVSDNGSTDATRAVVERVSADLSVPVRVIDSHQHPGLSYARNTGVRHAAGAVVLFCDSDDIVRPRWLASAVRGLTDADIVSGGIYPFTSSNRLGLEEPRGLISASFGPAILGCNFAMRRATYVSLGGCDESLPPYGCEDAELSIRANKSSMRIQEVDGMAIDFRRTVGAWANLRKAYYSGIAESIVFARHADLYPQQSGLGPALRRFGQVPVDLVRRLRSDWRMSVRSSSRRFVAAVGFFAGTLWFVTSGTLRPPLLMGVSE